MSIKIMNRVWEHSQQGGSARLLLLAIADNADEARGHAFPSIQTLASKTLMSARQIQRLVHELGGSGELAVKWGGFGRRKVNHYYVLIGMPIEQVTAIRQEVTQYNARRAAESADSAGKIKGDKMSPLSAGKGDILSPLPEKGDIAMSYDPSVNVVEVVVGEAEQALAHFLERKGNAYEFTEKDRRELAALFAGGFSLDDISRGIDAAFALPSKPQRFVQCARVTRQRFSPSCQAETRSPVIRPTDLQTPEAKVASVELGNALALFERIIAAPPAVGDAQKLAHLAALCDEAAQKAKSSGVLWLEEALELTLTAEGVKSPIRYAESILRAWIKHGKGADRRPTREGYRPPRKGPPKQSTQRQQLDDGASGEVINGVWMTRQQADEYYADIRKKREARQVMKPVAS